MQVISWSLRTVATSEFFLEELGKIFPSSAGKTREVAIKAVEWIGVETTRNIIIAMAFTTCYFKNSQSSQTDKQYTSKTKKDEQKYLLKQIFNLTMSACLSGDLPLAQLNYQDLHQHCQLYHKHADYAFIPWKGGRPHYRMVIWKIGKILAL